MINLHELNIWTIMLRLGLSLLLGSIVGTERGVKNRPAGLRTYSLVCLGSALIMLTNQYITEQYGVGDPTRMASQVISGIGFLGAGTILVTDRNKVSGLTTAAGLWTVASIGLAVGAGFYMGAIVGAVLLFTVMGYFLRFKERLGQYFLEVDLFIVLESQEAYHRLLIYCSQENIGIYNINSRIEDEELLDYPGHSSEDTCCILSINLQERYRKQILIETLSTFDGVKHLEEL